MDVLASDRITHTSYFCRDCGGAAGELDIHATMICFSNEDYTAEHTISNTCGFYYGLAPSCTEAQMALADLTWDCCGDRPL